MSDIQNDSTVPPRTDALRSEQRTLATLLFTDVVGFSKLAGINEERTFAALNRDFAMIREVVKDHGGQVANTMGDGMLIVFGSAVQGMQAAMQIQDNLHRHSLTNPPDGVLEHRMGLHVGDVLLDGQNVFGDGVNIAARLQVIARPNSIAYSKQVRDMVYNHVDLKNERTMATQRLRNIAENVSVFEIPPINETQRLQQAEDHFAVPIPIEQHGATGRRAIVLLAMAVVLIAMVIGVFYGFRNTLMAGTSSVEKGSGFAAAKKKIARNLPRGGSENTVAAVPDGASNIPMAENVPGVPFVIPADVEKLIQDRLSHYDFSGVAQLVSALPDNSSPEAQQLIASYQNLNSYKEWLSKEASLTTRENPLSVTFGTDRAFVYQSPGQGLVIEIDGKTMANELWQLDPGSIATIGAVASTRPPSGSLVPPDQANWAKLFRETYKL